MDQTSQSLFGPEGDDEGWDALCAHHGIHQTLNRVLIHERDEYMAAEIDRLFNIHSNDNIAVVVGENHIAGIKEALSRGVKVSDALRLENVGTLRGMFAVYIVQKLLE